MAALEAAFSIFCSYPSTSPKFLLCPRRSFSVKHHSSNSTPTLSLKFHLCSHPLLSINKTRKLSFGVSSAVQDIAVEEKTEQTQQSDQRKKLFVLNLPWSYTVADIKTLFGECGTVTDVEIIKQKDGKNRGFAFVTMSSAEEAQAVIDKFDSHELLGRIIRVEFAKRFKKPSRPPPVGPPPGETRYKLYVSNLAWKVSPSGRSAGYGFVSFATKEEAETAISSLDGKELLGRPIRLKFSEKNIDESGNEKDEEDNAEGQPEQS